MGIRKSMIMVRMVAVYQARERAERSVGESGGSVVSGEGVCSEVVGAVGVGVKVGLESEVGGSCWVVVTPLPGWKFPGLLLSFALEVADMEVMILEFIAHVISQLNGVGSGRIRETAMLTRLPIMMTDMLPVRVGYSAKKFSMSYKGTQAVWDSISDE